MKNLENEKRQLEEDARDLHDKQESVSQWEAQISEIIQWYAAGVAYSYSGFHLLLAHEVPPFKHGKDKMWRQAATFENRWPPFCQIWIIFTPLMLWIASARHNFKWVKIQIK